MLAFISKSKSRSTQRNNSQCYKNKTPVVLNHYDALKGVPLLPAQTCVFYAHYAVLRYICSASLNVRGPDVFCPAASVLGLRHVTILYCVSTN